MGFSPLANMSRRIADGGRSNPRNSSIRGFTIHHHAGVDAMSEAWNPARQASANYWIANDGTIIPHIDENRRAWTTGHINYPGGAQSDHRNITVEVSNSPEGVRTGTWAISAAALKSLINLIGDVFKRHNLGTVRRGTNGGVAVHQDFVPTVCPGPYIMSNLNMIITEAEKVRSGGKPAPKPAPTPPPNTGGKTIEQLADEVYRGDWGNGDTRRARLEAAGYNYAQVQARVDQKYYGGGGGGGGGGGSSSSTISQLADEVMRGDYGVGEERRRRLGSNYAAVQNEVNRRLYGGGGSSSGGGGGANGNIAALADAVMRGEYGNGDERKRRLGANYAAVQAEVNRRLGLGGGSSGGGGGGGGRKSNAQIAREIVFGEGHGGRNPWGNDPQRSQRLRAAGYDPAAVQREVNRLV